MLAEGMGFLETATGLCSSGSGLFGVGGGLFLGSPGGRKEVVLSNRSIQAK